MIDPMHHGGRDELQEILATREGLTWSAGMCCFAELDGRGTDAFEPKEARF
jgi:hypothetical protein